MWEMTLGKIIVMYREYKSRFDLEEKLIRNKIGYEDLLTVNEKKEHIVAF